LKENSRWEGFHKEPSSQKERVERDQTKDHPRWRGSKDQYQDSDFFTIVEVTGENRLGVLYEMTEALTDFGCDIHFARISTLGNRIVDVFYVQDEWGEKIIEKNKVDQLKKDRFPTPGRHVPRKPRLLSGVMGHNMDETSLSGSPAFGGELHSSRK